MNNDIELQIFHDQMLKLIIYENGTSMSDFLSYLQKEFKIDNPIQLMFGDAEITSVKSLFPNRKFRIRKKGENNNEEIKQCSDENSGDLIQNQNEGTGNSQSSHEDALSEKISLDELKNVNFSSSDLLNDLNIWANALKFHLVKTEGIKPCKEGYFRSYICNENRCKFRLTFKSDLEGKIYKLDERLAEKIIYTVRFFSF